MRALRSGGTPGSVCKDQIRSREAAAQMSFSAGDQRAEQSSYGSPTPPDWSFHERGGKENVSVWKKSSSPKVKRHSGTLRKKTRRPGRSRPKSTAAGRKKPSSGIRFSRSWRACSRTTKSSGSSSGTRKRISTIMQKSGGIRWGSVCRNTKAKIWKTFFSFCQIISEKKNKQKTKQQRSS